MSLIIALDFLTQISLLAFAGHLIAEGGCRLLRLHGWYRPLASLGLTAAVTACAYGSQPAAMLRRTVLEWLPSGFTAEPLAALWLIVAAVLAGRGVLRRMRFASAVRRAPGAGDDEAFSRACSLAGAGWVERRSVAGVEAVGVTGWRRPVVVVPESFAGRFGEEERLMIYLHELRHIRRGDAVFRTLHRALDVLLWPFAPLRWQLRRLEACAELLCDRAVMRIQPGRERYAGLIIRMAGGKACAVSFAGRGYREARQRIEALFCRSRMERGRLAALGALTLALACPLLWSAQNVPLPEDVPEACVIYEGDGSLELVPVDSLEKARQVAQGLGGRDAAYVRYLWEGLFGVYSQGESLEDYT